MAPERLRARDPDWMPPGPRILLFYHSASVSAIQRVTIASRNKRSPCKAAASFWMSPSTTIPVSARKVGLLEKRLAELQDDMCEMEGEVCKLRSENQTLKTPPTSKPAVTRRALDKTEVVLRCALTWNPKHPQFNHAIARRPAECS